jgi:hypothetical protein
MISEKKKPRENSSFRAIMKVFFAFRVSLRARNPATILETATGSPEVGGRKKNLRNLRNLPQSGDVIKTAPLQGNYGNYEN